MSKKLIIYSNRCIYCTHRRRLAEIRDFAKTHHLEIEERRTTRSKVWAYEANEIGIELPFLKLGGSSIHIKGELEKLL